jgi:hypothetical protein
MSAVQLDIGQKRVVDAVDAALDLLFAGGAEQPPGTSVIVELPGYNRAANIQGQDLRSSVRQAFTIALAGLSTGQPAWIAPTLNGVWANYGSGYAPAGYYKDALGVVHLRGLVASGTSTLVFTLPAGYRPEYHQVFAGRVSISAVESTARVDVRSDGEVWLNVAFGAADFLSLDHISFRAA